MGFDLRFADTEHLSSTYGADSLGSGPTVFQCNWLGVLDFLFTAALETIGLHDLTSFPKCDSLPGRECDPNSADQASNVVMVVPVVSS